MPSCSARVSDRTATRRRPCGSTSGGGSSGQTRSCAHLAGPAVPRKAAPHSLRACATSSSSGRSSDDVAQPSNIRRTQNGHIRNDTRDASRRTSSARTGRICRRNCVASDRACTRVTPRNLHGKEGADGSSPSEGLDKVPANWHITVVCPLNTRTQYGHIRGTRDAARPFATPADTLSQVRSRAHHRGSSCLEAITRCLNRRGCDPLSPERGRRAEPRDAGKVPEPRLQQAAFAAACFVVARVATEAPCLSIDWARLKRRTYTSLRDALHAALQ